MGGGGIISIRIFIMFCVLLHVCIFHIVISCNCLDYCLPAFARLSSELTELTELLPWSGGHI